jgi:hypothetical protein
MHKEIFMENDDPFEVRVGTFFLVLGMGAFLLFVTSDIAEKVDFDYLFVAVLLIGVGSILRRKKAPPPRAGRFAWVRKRFFKGGNKDSQQKPESNE